MTVNCKANNITKEQQSDQNNNEQLSKSRIVNIQNIRQKIQILVTVKESQIII